MKKIVLCALLSVAISAAMAQDVIVFKNADELQVKVTAVSEDKLSYRRWDNPDGPEYTIDKSQVFYVKYRNGTKDVFYKVEPAPASALNTSSDFSGVKFQSYLYAGAIFGSYGVGPAVDLSFGARVGRCFYAGFETGFHMFFGMFADAYVPIGANFKGYLPVSKRIYPYLNCSLGGFVGVSGFGGFYCQVGAGTDIGRFSVGIGYTGLAAGDIVSLGYVKLGVRFGKY